MVNEEQLRTALPHVTRTGLPLLVHAELQAPIDEATIGLPDGEWHAYRTYLESRPEEAELSAIRLLLLLCRQYKFRLHIVHLAAAAALPMLQAARAEGLPVSVETCPHYLHLAAEKIPDGATLFKCAPPIRSGENREKLWGGLHEGIVDLVATDHSPCPPVMKRLQEGDFRNAWGGIASLSVALAVLFTEASARGYGLPEIARWMGEGPAKLAGSRRKGRIGPGCDADFCLFDTEREFVVREERLHFRHRVSPYLGERLRGVVKATYLRGELVYADGKFCGKAQGQEYAHERG
jgi:allantoinase